MRHSSVTCVTFVTVKGPLMAFLRHLYHFCQFEQLFKRNVTCQTFKNPKTSKTCESYLTEPLKSAGDRCDARSAGDQDPFLQISRSKY